jgi:uncharacterized protein YcbX
MLYKVEGGKNMHVAEFTEMCLFTTEFGDAEGDLTGSNQVVVVTYTLNHAFLDDNKPFNPEDKLEIPLSPQTAGLGQVEITMHGSPCVGYDMGGEYDRWFSERFGYEVRLLYIGGNRRKVLGNMPPAVAAKQRMLTETDGNANRKTWLGSLTSTASSLVGAVAGVSADKENEYNEIDQGISFADVAPYLVISEKSWENAQNRLAGEAMDISKFRPNIIVEGADEEFEEDYWAELDLVKSGGNATRLVLTQNCARCNSLNVDYSTGKVGQGEAGKILKKLQSDRRVDPGAKWSPVFGRYGFLGKSASASTTMISVGDEVRVVRRNPERTKFGESFVLC